MTALAVLLPRVAAGLAATAFVLYYGAEMGRDLGFGSPSFALWFWAASLGWLVVVQWILRVTLVFGEGYYRPRAFEADGRLYRRLGVNLFGALMVNGALYNRLVRRFRPGHRAIVGRQGVERWEAATRGKEASHLAHALLIAPGLVAALLLGYLMSAATLLALTVLLDLYPVMLQRLNRARIYHLLRRASRRRQGERA